MMSVCLISTKHYQLAVLLAVSVFLFSPLLFAQDDVATPPAETDSEQVPAEETELPASQEVEMNEDNYRQFMELKDAREQRNMMPENAFKPGSGLQKLDDLPEDSQKHLRNQLREIIVQGDQWKPGDEATDYPYSPSEAASKNQPLQKQEKEAWGELVDGYHQREAEIHANSARSGAASAAGPPGGGTGSGQEDGEEDGSGEQSGQGEQNDQQSSSDQAGNEGSYSPNGSNDPNAKSTEGVSQNAMEFLKKMGNQGGNAEEGSDTPTGGNSGQGELQAQTGEQGNSQQGEPAGSGSQGASSESTTNSTAGTSQNAMEFLQGSGNQDGDAGEGNTESSAADNGQGQEGSDTQAQTGQQSEDEQTQHTATPSTTAPPVSSEDSAASVTEGATQNALEYLMGDEVQSADTTVDEVQTSESAGDPEGILTIEDLLNARGVGDVTGTKSQGAVDDPEEIPAKNTSDKDG
jgi:hypothetical protein